jgi:hypothetical protein
MLELLALATTVREAGLSTPPTTQLSGAVRLTRTPPPGFWPGWMAKFVPMKEPIEEL